MPTESPTAFPTAGSVKSAIQLPQFGALAAGYVATGADFDGSTNWLTRGAELTGNADGKLGIFSSAYSKAP